MWKRFAFTTGVLLAAVLAVVPLGRAKTYDRCELARDLLFKYKLPANQISQCKSLLSVFEKKGTTGR